MASMRFTSILKLMACTITILIAQMSISASAATINHPSLAYGFVNTANANSQLGTNLAPVTDYTTSYPFVNHFKMARPWFSGTLYTWQDSKTLSKDSNGNIKSLQSGQVARTVVFTGTPGDPTISGAVFNVYYQGSGRLEYSNCDVISRSTGLDVIRVKSLSQVDELTVIVALTQTNSKNYLRNIRMMPQGGICVDNPFATVPSASACSNAANYRDFATYESSIVFNPPFLEGLKRYNTIRFMDWLRINSSPSSSWSSRALISHQFWSDEKLGVPIEVVLALANILNANPWICIPHLYTNTSVSSLATLINSDLGTGTGSGTAPGTDRQVYLEYSNEIWNGMFSQTQYALNQGKAQNLHMPENDLYTGMARYVSKRSQEIFDLMTAKITSSSTRVKRVMATQAVVPYFTEVIMKYSNARTKTDAFAIAPYFGDTFTSAEQATALKNMGASGIFEWLNGTRTNAQLSYGSLPTIEQTIRNQVTALSAFGIPLVSYEGGQHLLAVGGAGNDATLDALLDSVNRDQRMKTIYLSYLDIWKRAGGTLFNHYVHCDRWSMWGRWGAQEYPSQALSAAPKLDALMQYASTSSG